ncbi:MAG TPA: phosphoglycerate mutase family protein [Pyrinomonadaceae bacterium]|nr:phosphoglycerate mutase family protein [Pyrinomonadaceae bacterium]
MKIFISLLSGLLLFAFAGENLLAQHRNITVILLRHAEKDKAEEEHSLDPNLSPEGRERAERLVKVIGGYNPDAIFSSAFKRTRATVAPLASRGELRIMAQYYDHRNLKQIADLVMQGKFQRIVIAGHNSTTPALANLLIGQEKYKALDESEYDKIWIIKIKRKKNKPDEIEEKVIQY